MFITTREHEWKQEVDYFFYRDFWWRHIFLIFFLQWASTQARSWEKVDFSSSTQRKSAQRQSFTGFFMCVLREKWEQRKMKFHCWCLSGKKSRKQRHTHFSSIFAQMQRHSMATVTMVVVVVVLLRCHNVDFKDTN